MKARTFLCSLLIIGLAWGWYGASKEAADLSRQHENSQGEIRSLKSQLSRKSRSIYVLEESLDLAKHGPYVAVANADIPKSLQELGVRVFRDRNGQVARAEVPDTTNFDEAATSLQEYPHLRIVTFVAGPVITGPVEWDSPVYRSKYVAAMSQSRIRTFTLNPENRQRALAVFREKLGDVKIETKLGAFY
jgi:hypothetical protein